MSDSVENIEVESALVGALDHTLYNALVAQAHVRKDLPSAKFLYEGLETAAAFLRVGRLTWTEWNALTPLDKSFFEAASRGMK